MSPEPPIIAGEPDTPPRALASSIVRWTAAIVAIIVGLLVLVHVLIRPIPYSQAAPEGHFGKPCAACHLVTERAEPVEL